MLQFILCGLADPARWWHATVNLEPDTIGRCHNHARSTPRTNYVQMSHLDKLRVPHEVLEVVTNQAVVIRYYIHNSRPKVLLRISEVVQPSVLEPLPAPKKSRVEEYFF